MPKPESATSFDQITCPFCGLCCDDLRLEVYADRIQVMENGCRLSQQRFDQVSLTSQKTSVRIDGDPASLESAIERAAQILSRADLPLIGTAGTDVAGMRATLKLAESSAAVLDTMYSRGTFRNLQVLQDRGWMSTTLTELRNRADLVIVMGERLFDRFPRLLERVLIPRKILWKDAWEPMFLKAAQLRDFVMVGPWKPAKLPRELMRRNPTLIHVALEHIGEVASALRAIIRGSPLQAVSLDNTEIAVLRETATRLKQARYAVIIWCAAELDFPHAELAIESWSELICELNTSSRCAGLALAGNETEATAQQVCTWLSGQPPRTAFLRGWPEHDPYLYDGTRVIEEDECDALLWISCFSPTAIPPITKFPSIVLGHPQMTIDPPPAVYIAIGIPGIDHPGHLYRMDQVVALPLRKLRRTALPSAAEVIAAIEHRYRHAGS